VFEFGGHCALVTGASSGLGIHFAKTLAAAGAAVALAARRKNKLDEIVRELRAQGRSATAIELDVTAQMAFASACVRPAPRSERFRPSS
jgi:NADP-dependent 3-hydroxy acid dehydrogenase YdfG